MSLLFFPLRSSQCILGQAALTCLSLGTAFVSGAHMGYDAFKCSLHRQLTRFGAQHLIAVLGVCGIWHFALAWTEL